MALSDYALIAVSDLKTYIGAQGNTEDARIEAAINAASSFIEQDTNRHFITRGAATEYHSVRDARHTIVLGHAPLITLTSVHESTASPRVYDATSLLTADTDYVGVSDAHRVVIRRLSASELFPWAVGYRCIKVVYSYGYADIAALPEDLKLAAKKLATSIYKEADRREWGATSITDAQGSVTRIGRLVTPDLRVTLDAYHWNTFERTWEAA